MLPGLAEPDFDEGYMRVAFNGGPFPDTPGYNILFTDYDYSIIYNCDAKRQREDMYIIARTSSITDAKLAELKTIANDAVPTYDFETMSENTV